MIEFLKIVLPPVLNLLVIIFVILFLLAMKARVARFLDDLGIKSAEIPGVGRIERFETLTAEAYEEDQKLGPPSPDDRRKIRAVGTYLAPFATGKRILWVDDKPGGNRNGRGALLELRIDVQTRRSTEEAMVELKDRQETYDLVISDWHRAPRDDVDDEDSEGLRLLRLMRSKEHNITTPLIFYHGKVDLDRLERRRQLAHAGGAVGATGSPGELFRWTMLELAKKSLLDEGGGPDISI